MKTSRESRDEGQGLDGRIMTHAPFFLPRLPQGGEGRGEEPMFTSTIPSPQPSLRLGGARELFPFGAGVKLHPRVLGAPAPNKTEA